ncbi:MAG: ABC transporter transmembrane domain-containing protein, partial [Proteobacteria bacterium]|nr:ABC transporter transmembrane domain-containing protein [Pseudomonadota bacterium]
MPPPIFGQGVVSGAVTGSDSRRGEELFGAVFDGAVISRFLNYLRPYRCALIMSIIAVLIYTLTQIAIPLVIRSAIDNALVKGADNVDVLTVAVMTFFGIIIVNYISNYFQLVIVARLAERILVDMRRAMYAHLQRVSLSFMDKTEVGRLMSRLQGDVSSIQEFLETSVFAIGDFVLLT